MYTYSSDNDFIIITYLKQMKKLLLQQALVVMDSNESLLWRILSNMARGFSPGVVCFSIYESFVIKGR